jgi:hypothetical protein
MPYRTESVYLRTVYGLLAAASSTSRHDATNVVSDGTPSVHARVGALGGWSVVD